MKQLMWAIIILGILFASLLTLTLVLILTKP
jgi:hypothetical protein